jgi:hypothetical protein
MVILFRWWVDKMVVYILEEGRKEALQAFGNERNWIHTHLDLR